MTDKSYYPLEKMIRIDEILWCAKEDIGPVRQSMIDDIVFFYGLEFALDFLTINLHLLKKFVIDGSTIREIYD